MFRKWNDFSNIWVIDYEFYSSHGDSQTPICYVAKNLKTDEIIKHWITGSETKPEYSIDEKTLIIAYYASAEMGCHIPLKFDIPPYILDLFVEFRCLTNGKYTENGWKLIGACLWYGLPTVGLSYKEHMQERILQGPPYSYEEKKDILDYCQKDVEMTTNLFLKMKEKIDLPYALLRGRYMAAVASMEYHGIPIDVEKLEELRNCWDIMIEELIARINEKYLVYDDDVFKIERFRRYLIKNKIPWRTTPTGLPKTDQKYMKDKAKTYPQLKPLQELRYMLGQLRLNKLQVGKDGRNRCLLSPFASKTSRSYPSSSEFIFANTIWIRGLVKPKEGMAVSYIDYSQQEMGVAAALSKDKNLLKAYLSGDTYLSFAKMAKAIPKNATRKTHSQERELYKTAMLAVHYGQGYKSFAENVNIPQSEARLLIEKHRLAYPQYWKWITNFIDDGQMKGFVKTRHHWYMSTSESTYRSIQNWPMQSHGAEVTRLAVCLCVENNITVLCSIHDAILIEDTVENIDDSVRIAQKCMEKASEYVINLKLRTEANTIKYPNRYRDPRGGFMWHQVWDIIDHIDPVEKEARIQRKMIEEGPIDNWKELRAPRIKPKTHLSKKMEQQRRMKPTSISEREMVDRIKRVSGRSHMEIMHLVNMARDSDFDLEHEIDWEYANYQTIKEKIQQRKTIRDFFAKE